MGSRFVLRRCAPVAAIAAAACLALTTSAGALPLRDSKLIYHGGPVMTKSVSYLIFWEPPKLQDGKTASVARTYNSLIKRFFNDENHTTFMDIPTEYEVFGGQQITNSATLGGSWVDTHAYPASGCSDSATPGDCLSQDQVVAEIKHAMKQNSWKAAPTHAFYLFTAKGEGSCLPDSSCALVQFCAYNTTFPKGAKTAIYANMPYDQTITTGCNVDRTPNHDLAADTEINMASAAQMAMITDPAGNGWSDQTTGQRISDLCQTQFGAYGFDGGKANQKLNGHNYVLQEEWSNKMDGCIQGD